MEDISVIEPDFTGILQDDSDQFLADQLKAESVDSALGGSTISILGEPHARSTPVKLTEREQELARIIDEIDNEMDDELADDCGIDGSGRTSLTPSLRFDTLSTPTQILAHTNSDSARVQLLMDQLRRCQTQLREAKYRCDVLEVDRDSQERKMQEKLESRIETVMSDAARAEMVLKGKMAEQQAENKALLDQLQQAKDELTEKTKGKAVIMWKHTENTRRMQSELTDTKLMLKKVEAQLQEELCQRKNTAERVAKLNVQIQTLLADKESAPELSRKTNLLEEQVQYLTMNLEDSRREHSLKLAAVEQKLITENNKLKVKEKDYQRKYKREQERNRSHSQNMKALKAELKHVKEDIQMGALIDRVKSPVVDGEWSKFKLDSKKNKRALQDILVAIESEGGPDSNHQLATDAIYFQTVIYYLWVKRDASIKTLKEAREKLKTFDNCPNNFKELVIDRDNLKERVQELEERLQDWMAENDTLQSSTHLTTTQLVGTKHELELKVKHLQDTVSALHLDNNLMRADLERSPTPKLSAQVQDLTADSKLKLDVAETELKQEKLVTEELGTELKHSKAHCDQLSKALQEKEDEHKAAMKKLREANAKVIELEKKKAVMDAQVERIKQEKNNAKDNAQKLEKKLRDATSDLNQVKQKQDKTNRARDALKSQIDALKAEVIEVKGQNVSLMQDNETLEDRLQDVQEELEKARMQLEVQLEEMVYQTTEEKVEAAVLSETLKSEQDRVEELDLDMITKKAKISQLEFQLGEQKKKYQKRVQVEKAKFKGLQDALKDKETAVSDLKQKLQKEVTEKNIKMLALKNKLATQESKLQNVDDASKLQEQLDEQEKEFSVKEQEHQKRCKEFEEALEDKESSISDLEMQVADIIDEKATVISDLENQISKWKQKNKTENQKDASRLKILEEREKVLATELDDARKTCKNLQKSIQEKSKEIDKLVKDMKDAAKKKNDKIASLESDMKNQGEKFKRDGDKKVSDLQDKLSQFSDQEQSFATKLDEEKAKCQILRKSVAMKDECIAQLEQKLSEKLDLDNASRIALLEKQLEEQEKNFKIEVDEEAGKFKYLEENLNKKDGMIEKLKEQLKQKMEEETDDVEKKREEVKRMEELIKLEEKMSALIEEKDKMQERIQILSKDKTVLQADKQLLELELADRTKKLQKIMRESSITGTTSCSSRSSSRRSSIDSRVGWGDSRLGKTDPRVAKSLKDSEKEGKKSKKSKIPIRDENDGIQKGNLQIMQKDDKKGPTEMIRKPSIKANSDTTDETLQNGSHGNYSSHANSFNDEMIRKPSNKSSSSTADEALQNGSHGNSNNHGNKTPSTTYAALQNDSHENSSSNGTDSNDLSNDPQRLDANTDKETERLKIIDDFVTTLLDLQISQNNDNDFENIKAEIEAIQHKASSGSNRPVKQRQAVVAKLGALYQVMKAKKKFACKRMQSDQDQDQTKNGAEKVVPDKDFQEKDCVQKSRFQNTDLPISKEEVTLLQSMPALILEAINAIEEDEKTKSDSLRKGSGSKKDSYGSTDDCSQNMTEKQEPHQQGTEGLPHIPATKKENLNKDKENPNHNKQNPSKDLAEMEDSVIINDLDYSSIEPTSGNTNQQRTSSNLNRSMDHEPSKAEPEGSKYDIDNLLNNSLQNEQNYGSKYRQKTSNNPNISKNNNSAKAKPKDNRGNKSGQDLTDDPLQNVPRGKGKLSRDFTNDNANQVSSKPVKNRNNSDRDYTSSTTNKESKSPKTTTPKYNDSDETPRKDRSPLSTLNLPSYNDTSESYGICDEVDKSKKGSRQVLMSNNKDKTLNTTRSYVGRNSSGNASGNTSRNSSRHGPKTSPRTDGGESFTEGDDDVFGDTGVQNEGELERLAIMHALVNQMRRSPSRDNDEDTQGRAADSIGSTIKDDEDGEQCMSMAQYLNTDAAKDKRVHDRDSVSTRYDDEDDQDSMSMAKSFDEKTAENKEVGPFVVESWMSEIGDKVVDNQEKPQILVPDDDIILPTHAQNNTNLEHNHNNDDEEDEEVDDENEVDDEASLDKLMEKLGNKFDIVADPTSGQSNKPTCDNSDLLDDMIPEACLSDFAERLHDEQEHPVSMKPDEEVIELHPSSISDEGSENLFRKLPPEELEERLQARVENVLHSANPRGIFGNRYSASSQLDKRVHDRDSVSTRHDDDDDQDSMLMAKSFDERMAENKDVDPFVVKSWMSEVGDKVVDNQEKSQILVPHDEIMLPSPTQNATNNGYKSDSDDKDKVADEASLDKLTEKLEKTFDIQADPTSGQLNKPTCDISDLLGDMIPEAWLSDIVDILHEDQEHPESMTPGEEVIELCPSSVSDEGGENLFRKLPPEELEERLQARVENVLHSANQSGSFGNRYSVSSQLDKRVHDRDSVSTRHDDEDGQDSMSTAKSFDKKMTEDKDVDPFEVESWMSEVGDKVVDNQMKPQILVPDDETILPSPAQNDTNLEHKHNNDADDEVTDENEVDDEACLDKLMETLGKKFDIEEYPASGQSNKPTCDNSDLLDDMIPEAWLSDLAERLHDEQKHPVSMKSDEEVIELCPSSVSSDEGSVDLTRKLPPVELEERLQARVENVLHSANPRSTFGNRYSASSQRDDPMRMDDSMTAPDCSLKIGDFMRKPDGSIRMGDSTRKKNGFTRKQDGFMRNQDGSMGHQDFSTRMGDSITEPDDSMRMGDSMRKPDGSMIMGDSMTEPDDSMIMTDSMTGPNDSMQMGDSSRRPDDFMRRGDSMTEPGGMGMGDSSIGEPDGPGRTCDSIKSALKPSSTDGDESSGSIKSKNPNTQTKHEDSVAEPKGRSSKSTWKSKMQFPDENVMTNSRRASSQSESDMSSDKQAKHMGLREYLSQKSPRGRPKSKLPRSARSQSLNSKHIRSDSSEAEIGKEIDNDKTRYKHDKSKPLIRRSKSSEHGSSKLPRKKQRDISKSKAKISDSSENELTKPVNTAKKKHRNLPKPKSRPSGSSDKESAMLGNNRDTNIDNAPKQKSNGRRKLPLLTGTKIPVTQGMFEERQDIPKSSQSSNESLDAKNQPTSSNRNNEPVHDNHDISDKSLPKDNEAHIIEESLSVTSEAPLHASRRMPDEGKRVTDHLQPDIHGQKSIQVDRDSETEQNFYPDTEKAEQEFDTTGSPKQDHRHGINDGVSEISEPDCCHHPEDQMPSQKAFGYDDFARKPLQETLKTSRDSRGESPHHVQDIADQGERHGSLCNPMQSSRIPLPQSSQNTLEPGQSDLPELEQSSQNTLRLVQSPSGQNPLEPEQNVKNLPRFEQRDQQPPQSGQNGPYPLKHAQSDQYLPPGPDQSYQFPPQPTQSDRFPPESEQSIRHSSVIEPSGSRIPGPRLSGQYSTDTEQEQFAAGITQSDQFPPQPRQSNHLGQSIHSAPVVEPSGNSVQGPRLSSQYSTDTEQEQFAAGITQSDQFPPQPRQSDHLGQSIYSAPVVEPSGNSVQGPRLSSQYSTDTEQEQFAAGITQFVNMPDEEEDDLDDICDDQSKELQGMADDEASDTEPIISENINNFEQSVPSETSKDIPGIRNDEDKPTTEDKDTQTDDVAFIEDTSKVQPLTTSECQTDEIAIINNEQSLSSLTTSECQTDDIVIMKEGQTIPTLTSSECQTDEVPLHPTRKEQTMESPHQTEYSDLPSQESTGCQTDLDKDSPSVTSVECQTIPDDGIATMEASIQTAGSDMLSTGCQTNLNKDSPSTTSVECQTVPDLLPSTATMECQTDPEDDAFEVSLMDRIEGLQNLSDKQKMKTKAFKEAAKTYKGEMQRMHQQMINDKEDLATLHDKTTAQEAELHQLTHKNHELKADLGLTRDYLDEKKDECQQLQKDVYDAEVKETDLTSTLKEIQDQLGIEKQIQDKLSEKCAELEAELLDAISKLLKQPQPTQQPDGDVNLSVGDGSQDSHSPPLLSPNKTAKQVQNETDDRKKLSELQAQNEMAQITIDTLTEENQHLREIIAKLKEKAYSKWKENPNSQFKDVYQALAKAQVNALAMKLAENPDDMGNTMTAFGDTMTSPSFRSGSGMSLRPGSAMSGLGTTLGSEFGYN